jgi:ATP-dependent protease ClpP protease subunit
MSDEAAPKELPSKKLYGIFAGTIDQLAVQRLANIICVASQQGVTQIHLIFQTTGGIVGDGICLYNIFQEAPMDIHLYNVGNVASIGVIAYLGADFRKTTKNAAFMIHKVTFSPQAATVDRLQSAANAAALDDKRIEGILQTHIDLPNEKWDIHKVSDLWLSAEDAIQARLAESIEDFCPPYGEQIFYVGP